MLIVFTGGVRKAPSIAEVEEEEEEEMETVKTPTPRAESPTPLKPGKAGQCMTLSHQANLPRPILKTVTPNNTSKFMFFKKNLETFQFPSCTLFLV